MSLAFLPVEAAEGAEAFLRPGEAFEVPAEEFTRAEEALEQQREQAPLGPATASYFEALRVGEQACGGDAACHSLLRAQAARDVAFLRAARAYFPEAPTEIGGWDPQKTGTQNFLEGRLHEPDVRRLLESVAGAVAKRRGTPLEAFLREDPERPCFDETRGNAQQQQTAKQANSWMKVFRRGLMIAGGAAGAGALIAYLVQRLGEEEAKNSFCSVKPPGKAYVKLDCAAAIGDDYGRVATLQKECSCLGTADGPCGGLPCQVLQGAKGCAGLEGFDPQGASRCRNGWDYNFTSCDVMCGMMNVAKHLRDPIQPEYWMRTLLMFAAVAGALLLLVTMAIHSLQSI